jgi:crotonobetainyl-CoA:carnitine CoA-transferase CaiB-like acyl-CoA transferase
MRLLDEIRIAYSSVNDMGDVAEHPAVERAMIAAVDSANGPAARTFVGLGEPVFGVESEQRGSRPAVGEDTEAVRRSLGLATESI